MFEIDVLDSRLCAMKIIIYTEYWHQALNLRDEYDLIKDKKVKRTSKHQDEVQ